MDGDGLPVGTLETAASAEARRSSPHVRRVLGDRPLLWVDTTGSDMEDEPQWSNPKEAVLVGRIAAELRETDGTPPSLAVLTPYHAQRALLEQRGLRGDTHTVHSFQGSEADVVLVSLVRTTLRYGGERAQEHRSLVSAGGRERPPEPSSPAPRSRWKTRPFRVD